MSTIPISAPPSNKIRIVAEALANCGWTAVSAPEGGKLAANRQRLVLETEKRRLSLRLSIYKVGGSSRGKQHERRFQITTTYGPRFARNPRWMDVVLGYDEESEIFVGANAERLAHGGNTSNASTFFDNTGLERASSTRLLVEPYPSRLFGGTEYHAFISGPRFAEYFFNSPQIHAGLYKGGGPFSVRADGYPSASRNLRIDADMTGGDVLVMSTQEGALVPLGPDGRLVQALEVGDRAQLRKARLTPEAFARIQRRAEENGFLGEQLVVNLERAHLIREGRTDLAARVEWTSQQWVDAGFDIRSFSIDGADRFIEVKTTEGTRRVFEMSDNEWKAAARIGDAYSIYRVTRIRRRPEVRMLRDPINMLEQGSIKRTASGWRVSYR